MAVYQLIHYNKIIIYLKLNNEYNQHFGVNHSKLLMTIVVDKKEVDDCPHGSEAFLN